MKEYWINLLLLFFSIGALAQNEVSPILIIYDASGSMWGKMEGELKKDIAAEVLGTTIMGLPEDQAVGLIAYGHRKKGDCDDIEYLVDLDNVNKGQVKDVVSNLNPTGKTPLARSAMMAIKSLKQQSKKATIILITDGIESCDGDLCMVIKNAKQNGIDFKLHIIGFGIKEGDKDNLKCASKAGDGQYYDAENSGGLGEVLIEATSSTVDDPEPNFSLYAVKNGIPVDAWVKPINVDSDEELGAARTYRDTAKIFLPPGKYSIGVRALENSDLPAISIEVEMQEGQVQHKDISFDGGTLEVLATNNGEPCDAVVKMYDSQTNKVVANTRTYGRSQQMEVPAGKYKVSFQALNMKGILTYVEIDNVEVVGNDTRDVTQNFETGIAMIGVKTQSGDLIDATVNFVETITGKRVAGSRTYTSASNNPRKFILNPGTYEVKIVTLGVHKGGMETLMITVKTGKTVEKVVTF